MAMSPLLVLGGHGIPPDPLVDLVLREGDSIETRVQIVIEAYSKESWYQPLHPRVEPDGSLEPIELELEIASKSHTLILDADKTRATRIGVVHEAIALLGEVWIGEDEPGVPSDYSENDLGAAMQICWDPDLEQLQRIPDWGKTKPTPREKQAMAGAPSGLEVFGLLPRGTLEVGDEWQVDSASWVGALFPFGDYSLAVDSTLVDVEVDPDGDRYEGSFLEGAIGGESTGEYLGKVDIDGKSFLQFTYDYKLLVDVPLCSLVDDLVAAPEANSEWGVPRELRMFGASNLAVTLSGEAVLMWDEQQRIIHSLVMEFDFQGELGTPAYLSWLHKEWGQYEVDEQPAGLVQNKLSGDGQVILKMLVPKRPHKLLRKW